jgi:hypothetical protein
MHPAAVSGSLSGNAERPRGGVYMLAPRSLAGDAEANGGARGLG